jgi:hypothetical protein
MALELIVERNYPEDIQDDISRLFFYDGGITALTLVSECYRMLLMIVSLEVHRSFRTTLGIGCVSVYEDNEKLSIVA